MSWCGEVTAHTAACSHVTAVLHNSAEQYQQQGPAWHVLLVVSGQCECYGAPQAVQAQHSRFAPGLLQDCLCNRPAEI